MTVDDLGMHVYDLENHNEALSLRTADLERILADLRTFLASSDLPYRVVAPWVGAISQKLERELSSYRV